MVIAIEKLTVKQQAFADHYIECGNATEAAKKAGYSAKTAGVIGDENLKKPYIAEYIKRKLDEIASKRIADAAEVLEYLTAAMRGEVTEEMVVVEGYGDGCSQASTVKKQISAKDRNKAAELLGKRHSLFTDRVALEGDMEVTINVDYGDDE